MTFLSSVAEMSLVVGEVVTVAYGLHIVICGESPGE